jgi:hypothetical protein
VGTQCHFIGHSLGTQWALRLTAALIFLKGKTRRPYMHSAVLQNIAYYLCCIQTPAIAALVH